MKNLFTHSITAGEMTFKHARGVSDRSGKEFHLFHEIIYFLDGDAEFVSENLHMRPAPETVLLIPKEHYHQMIIHGDREHYYRCVIQFPDHPKLLTLIAGTMTDITAIRADEEIRYLFGKLIAVGDRADENAVQLLEAALTLFLDSVGSKKTITTRENLQTELIQQAIEYINRNIGQPLLLSDLAMTCNVSVSTLSHLFKEKMNISIHKFIIQKRLIRAHHKICDGHAATVAAMECGFKDYSGFYKQYRTFFGVAPSKSKQQVD